MYVKRKGPTSTSSPEMIFIMIGVLDGVVVGRLHTCRDGIGCFGWSSDNGHLHYILIQIEDPWFFQEAVASSFTGTCTYGSTRITRTPWKGSAGRKGQSELSWIATPATKRRNVVFLFPSTFFCWRLVQYVARSYRLSAFESCCHSSGPCLQHLIHCHGEPSFLCITLSPLLYTFDRPCVLNDWLYLHIAKIPFWTRHFWWSPSPCWSLLGCSDSTVRCIERVTEISFLISKMDIAPFRTLTLVVPVNACLSPWSKPLVSSRRLLLKLTWPMVWILRLAKPFKRLLMR